MTDKEIHECVRKEISGMPFMQDITRRMVKLHYQVIECDKLMENNKTLKKENVDLKAEVLKLKTQIKDKLWEKFDG